VYAAIHANIAYKILLPDDTNPIHIAGNGADKPTEKVISHIRPMRSFDKDSPITTKNPTSYKAHIFSQLH
jgi:hypothetical protein